MSHSPSEKSLSSMDGPSLSRKKGKERKERKSNTSNNNENTKKKITKDDIGKPENFQHLGHIGWDPQHVYDIDRLDEKWKELIGVTDEQMQKKELVDFIFDLVEKRGGIDNMSWDIEMQRATASQKEIEKTVPQAIVVSCEKEIPDRPSQYAEKEFHGSLTQDEAEGLLSKANDGGYLVWKTKTSPGRLVLSLRHLFFVLLPWP